MVGILIVDIPLGAEAFLCFIGSVESLNDVCCHMYGYSSAVAVFLKMSYIYIYYIQYNNYLHFLHKRTSDMKCILSDNCWMALN